MGKYLTIAQQDIASGKSGRSPLPPVDLPVANPAPTYTEEREHFIVDYYCSRPRVERLVMYRRGQELRRLHPGWPGDACDLQAMEEHFSQYPATPPFIMARDGIAFGKDYP